MLAASSSRISAAQPGASSRKRSLSDTGLAEETLRIEVQMLSGARACVVDVNPNETKLRDVKNCIANSVGACACRLQFVAGGDVVREGLLVRRWIEKIKPAYILHVIIRVPEASGLSAVVLHDQGYCFKCMREFGVEAKELLNVKSFHVDALKLRYAGYSLSELRNAGPIFQQRRIHPPVTPHTLFDSQLKAAGYTAFDFRAAGYTAEELSEDFFWEDAEELTAGDIEWEQCCAFFSASALKDAGYCLEDLQRAFPESKLRE